MKLVKRHAGLMSVFTAAAEGAGFTQTADCFVTEPSTAGPFWGDTLATSGRDSSSLFSLLSSPASRWLQRSGLDTHPVSAHRARLARLHFSHRMAVSVPAVKFEQELSQASRIRGVVPSDGAPLGNAVMFISVMSP